MRGIFEYVMIGIVALLAFFCFLIGTDKMIKLIVGSTVLMIVVLGWSALLNTWIFYLNKLGVFRKFLGITQPILLHVIQSIDTMTSVFIFVGLMIFMMSYAHLDVVFDNMYISPQAQQLILVPAAIVSLLVGLVVAVLGVDVFDPAKLQVVASVLTNNIQVQTVIIYSPLAIIVQGSITLRLISSLGIVFGRSEE